MMANSGLFYTHSMITNIILVVKIQRQKKKKGVIFHYQV